LIGEKNLGVWVELLGEEVGRKNPYFIPLIGEKNVGVWVELLGEEVSRKNPYFIPLIGEKNLRWSKNPLGRGS
jgi:hypothetical protein